MPHPNTYLMTAPIDYATEFGVVMSSANLLAGLKRIDNRFAMPPSTGVVYIAPQPVDGITGLWLGSPYTGGRYICALHEGMIPEYTMLEKGTGKVFKRGWRAIFEKIIAAKIVSRFAIEQEFNINLVYDGASGLCRDCQRRGYRVPATCVNRYCEDCFDVRMTLAAAEEHKKEVRFLREHPAAPNPGRVSLYLGS